MFGQHLVPMIRPFYLQQQPLLLLMTPSLHYSYREAEKKESFEAARWRCFTQGSIALYNKGRRSFLLARRRRSFWDDDAD